MLRLLIWYGTHIEQALKFFKIQNYFSTRSVKKWTSENVDYHQREQVHTRLVGFGPLGLQHRSSAPAARASGGVDQAAALMLELLWVFCGCADVAPRVSVVAV